MTYVMFMFPMNVYCLKVKNMNGKLTFGSLKVVHSVDGGTGHY